MTLILFFVSLFCTKFGKMLNILRHSDSLLNKASGIEEYGLTASFGIPADLRRVYIETL